MINTVIPAGRSDAPLIPRSVPELRAAEPAGRLRAVLAANSATSAAVGLVGLVAAKFWATKLGLENVIVVRIVSAALIVFAIAVALVALRSASRLRLGAALISAVDVAWVIGTVAVLATAGLSTFGTIVAVVLGIGVADFAAVQLWYRSRAH